MSKTTERGAFEMIAHEVENIFSVDRNNLRAGGAGPCGADLYGLASHDRGLVKSVSWIALIVAGGFALIAFRFTANDDN
jgi:hypothetical protein